jgi:hypothetical protein
MDRKYNRGGSEMKSGCIRSHPSKLTRRYGHMNKSTFRGTEMRSYTMEQNKMKM